MIIWVCCDGWSDILLMNVLRQYSKRYSEPRRGNDWLVFLNRLRRKGLFSAIAVISWMQT